LRSAKEKHGLTPVVGPTGEEAPCLPEEPAMPKLSRERLATGEEVYRVVAEKEDSVNLQRKFAPSPFPALRMADSTQGEGDKEFTS
jgi:hypothetical protein